MRKQLIPLMLASLVTPAFAADVPPADRRVQKLLDQRKLQYEIDEQGDFRITYALADGRSQLAFVRSTSVSYGSLQLREIVSAGYRSANTELPSVVANRLLEISNQSKLGAWVRQGSLALFVSRIAVDADARELADAIEFTVSVADATEKELSGGKDEF